MPPSGISVNPRMVGSFSSTADFVLNLQKRLSVVILAIVMEGWD